MLRCIRLATVMPAILDNKNPSVASVFRPAAAAVPPHPGCGFPEAAPTVSAGFFDRAQQWLRSVVH